MLEVVYFSLFSLRINRICVIGWKGAEILLLLIIINVLQRNRNNIKWK
jgi:hypothetical protein